MKISRETKMEFKEPSKAFGEAIHQGLLSVKESDPHYAGLYMYIGTEDGVDLFKNINTRKYLRSEA